MRDAYRYQRQKRIGGKSGDSGDEVSIDGADDVWELKDALTFLAPTSFRFPRKTIVLGGSTDTPETSLSQARTPKSAHRRRFR